MYSGSGKLSVSEHRLLCVLFFIQQQYLFVFFCCVEDSIVSHHTKSSPVPIKRKGNAASSALSNSPSPKQSISPVSACHQCECTVIKKEYQVLGLTLPPVDPPIGGAQFN